MTTARGRRRRTIDLADVSGRARARSRPRSATSSTRPGRHAATRWRCAPIYERHAGLFDRAAIDALQRLRRGRRGGRAPGAPPVGIRGRSLRRASGRRPHRADREPPRRRAGDHVARRADRLPRRRHADRRSGATAASATRSRRSYLEAVEAINPLRLERLLRMRAATAELGFSDAVEMAAAVHGFDPDALAGELQAFIADSETPYYAALRRYLAEIDIEAGDAIGRRPRLSHARQQLGRAGSRRAASCRSRPRRSGGSGMDVAAQPNVTLDVEQRPNKSPRAFCVAVRVPERRAARRPAARRAGRLRAPCSTRLGHVEHFAHAAADLPAAYRHVGDTSVTEGYAFVLGSPRHRARLARRAPAHAAGGDRRLR